MPLADTLLRLAEQGFYHPFWSEKILEETVRALGRMGHARENAEWRVNLMRAHFPEAMVTRADDIQFSPGLPDPDDEHVLAVAVTSEAQAIITINLRDFPTDVCARHDIEVLHPDEFLVSLFDLAPDVVCNVIVEQSRDLQNPAVPVWRLVAGLKRDAPEFSDLVETELRRRDDT